MFSAAGSPLRGNLLANPSGFAQAKGTSPPLESPGRQQTAAHLSHHLWMSAVSDQLSSETIESIFPSQN